MDAGGLLGASERQLLLQRVRAELACRLEAIPAVL
jgi:hypothetical protein